MGQHERAPKRAIARVLALVALCSVGLAAESCVYDFDPPAGYCDSESRCPEGEYCAYPDLQCGREDLGRCVGLPQCSPTSVRVCGCDGQIYEGLCQAVAAGVDLTEGGCTMQGGEFGCGYGICLTATDYCVAYAGGPLQQPVFECRKECVPPSCSCAMAAPHPGYDCSCSQDRGAVTVLCAPVPI